MSAKLSFEDGSNAAVSGAAADVDSIKTVIYEDDTGNKYTLNFSTLATPALQFLPQGGTAGNEIDFSNLAGLVSAVSAIQTKIGTIETKANLIPAGFDTTVGDIATAAGKIAGIETKANLIPVGFDTTVGDIATAAGKIVGIETKANLIPVGFDTTVGDIATAAGKIAGIETKANLIPVGFDTTVGDIATAAGKIVGIETNVNAINTNVGGAPLANTLATATKLQEVKEETAKIEAKTVKMPADLSTVLAASTLTITSEVAKVKDAIPVDLGTKLDKLATADNLKEVKDAIPTDLGTKFDGLAKSTELNGLATAASVTELTGKIVAGSAAGSELKTTLGALNVTLGGLKCEASSAPAQLDLSSLQGLASDAPLPDAWTNI